MNKFLLLIISLLLCTITLSAQNNQGTISGEVRDSQGALVGASVFLIRDMSTQEIVKYTTSENNGKFTLTAPVGTYMLGVSFIGYTIHAQQVQVTADKTNLGTITLEETTQDLQTVVVQGKPVRVHTKPDGFVVNVREIREKANDALDLLKLIPKVQIKGDQLRVIGKEKVLVKIGNVLQRVDASEIVTVLKGYDAGLIDRVEVITQPPLRYDPDGNTSMIILHTSSVFNEYMGGTIATEEMWGGKDNYRFGGYGSLLYNHRGVFVSIAPSINFNGSKSLEQQEYQTEHHLYKTYTPSSGQYNYKGLQGNVQYEYGEKDFLGLALSWNKKTYDNQFESRETMSERGIANRIVDNQNTYNSKEPRFTATAYWETAFGKRGNQIWTDLSYFNLSTNPQTDYAGREHSMQLPFLAYTARNVLSTSGLNFNNDYSIYLDENRNYLLEAGVKGSWSSTSNYRAHDESRSLETPIHQKNNIRWDELIVTPYISSTLKFSKQWWMRLGLRYVGTKSHLQQIDKTSTAIPDVSRYDEALLPTLHASYTPSSNHQVALTFNSSIEHPKFKELNPFVWQINEHSFYRGNTNLRPQQYYTTRLGYTFMNALSIRGCVKRGIGIITDLSTMQGNQVYTQVENAQNNLFWGIEAEYYFDKLSWVNANIDGYYGRNRYTSRSQELLPMTQSNEWGINGYLDFTFNENRTWTGYLSVDYTGRKHTTIADIDPQYDLGMGVNYFLLDRRLSISVAGLNLLSSRYKGVSHRQGYSMVFDNRYNYPTLYVSVSYKFSNAKDKSTSRSSGTTQDIERRF